MINKILLTKGHIIEQKKTFYKLNVMTAINVMIRLITHVQLLSLVFPSSTTAGSKTRKKVSPAWNHNNC